MFPLGTREIPVPYGISRLRLSRGVFHYKTVSSGYIRNISEARRENEILGLGPYNKDDILQRMLKGERLIAISEIYCDGTEVKSASGTPSTIERQYEIFNKLKLPESVVRVETVEDVVRRRIRSRD